jgi:hypothetical protein
MWNWNCRRVRTLAWPRRLSAMPDQVYSSPGPVRGGHPAAQEIAALSCLNMTNRHIHFASAELAAIQERVAPMDKLEIKPMRVPKKR